MSFGTRLLCDSINRITAPKMSMYSCTTSTTGTRRGTKTTTGNNGVAAVVWGVKQMFKHV